MKIAILSSYFFQEAKELHGRDRIIFGGGERVLYELCKFLQSESHQVTVYQPIHPPKDTNPKKIPGQIQKNYKGIPIICLPGFDRWTTMGVNPELNQFFNEVAGYYDVAIFFTTFLAYPHVPKHSISICHGIYWDYSHHTYGLATEDGKREYLRQHMYGFEAPAVCIAVDSNVKRVIQAIKPGAESNIRVIPNFCDTEKFVPAEKTWEGIRVLYPRRLTILRGQNEFIRASQQHPEYHYLAVGQATSENTEKQAQEWAKTVPHLQFIHKEMDGMEEVYQQSDIAVIPTKACEGLSLSCLPAGTEIIIDNGRVKNIEEIQIGDFVLTHTGQYQEVTETMSRKADALYKIKVGGGFGTTVEMTGEHPVLAFKPPKHKNGWACRQGCARHPLQSKNYWENATPSWIKASELERGDVVVFPKIKTDEWKGPLAIDLAEFLQGEDWLFDDEHVWHRYSNSKNNVKAKEIAKILNVSISTVYHAIQPSQKPSFRWDLEKTKLGRVIKYLEENEIDLTNKFPRYIPFDKGFMRLLGYYVAEGYSKDGVVGFCFHAKEKEYHADVISLMRKYFNVDADVSIDGNKAKIIFCGKVVEEVFSGLVGKGAKNKTLSEVVMSAPKEYIIEFLIGLYRGDGHIRSDCNTKALVNYVSASRNLTQQVHLLLTRFGIYGQIKIRQHADNRKTWAINVNGEGAYRLIELLRFNITYAKRKRASHQQYFEYGGYFCGVIESIEARKFDDQVYNIEVEKDNSYIANGIVVHNCLESMSCGLPVITTYAGGIGDAVIDGYNALVFDPHNDNLADYIHYLAQNEQLRKVMGERNREIAKCFDIKIWQRRWKQIIDQF